jgi:hypothetical protein
MRFDEVNSFTMPLGPRTWSASNLLVTFVRMKRGTALGTIAHRSFLPCHEFLRLGRLRARFFSVTFVATIQT